MDAPAQTDEASQQMMLIAQRDEVKKIFNIPPGSLLEQIINNGEGFENYDEEAVKSNPYLAHQRKFKVRDLLGDEEKTVIVDTTIKGKMTKTTFSIIRMTPQNTAANRLDISYESYSDSTPSVVTVNAVPSGQAHGIAFDLTSLDKISYIDDTTRALRQPTADINKTPLELRLFSGMRMQGFKADPNHFEFQMHAFPNQQSKPITINLPRTLKR